jgi:uncharacterized repeat protein (TIGR01451 family)
VAGGIKTVAALAGIVAVALLAIGAAPAAAQSGCAGGEAYDDGSNENGYTGNFASKSIQFVQRFTPSVYPATYTRVCLALTRTSLETDLDFEVEAYDDDGPGGGPGTFLGSLPAVATSLPNNLPCAFYEVDVSQLGFAVMSGSVFLGLRWSPAAQPDRYVCSDESASTPLHPAFTRSSLASWDPVQTAFLNFRALAIRALSRPAAADLAIAKQATLLRDGRIGYELTVTNKGPDRSPGATVTDALPPQVAFSSDSCAGAGGPPWSWRTGPLASGASIRCSLVVGFVATGQIANSATVAGVLPDLAPGNNTATATVEVKPFRLLGRVKRNKRRGTAILSVSVPAPGKVTLGGKGIKRQVKTAALAGVVKLNVVPTGKAKERLADKGKASVRARIAYVGPGGQPTKTSTLVKLVKSPGKAG